MACNASGFRVGLIFPSALATVWTISISTRLNIKGQNITNVNTNTNTPLCGDVYALYSVDAEGYVKEGSIRVRLLSPAKAEPVGQVGAIRRKNLLCIQPSGGR